MPRIVRMAERLKGAWPSEGGDNARVEDLERWWRSAALTARCPLVNSPPSFAPLFPFSLSSLPCSNV